MHELIYRGGRVARAFGIGDPSACAGFGSDPQFLGSWQPIAAQIQGEGGTAGDVLYAQQAFCQSLSGMSNQFGVDYTDALAAASNFTAIAHTAQGAIQHIQGLAQAVADNEPAPVIVSQMAGLVVGVGMAASIIAPGVGAAVMAGIAIVGGLLGGLFQPSGVTVCPGVKCDPAPTFVVNCTCFWDPIVHSPGGPGFANPSWRVFPKPGDLGPLGVPWYGAAGAAGGRLIDHVFPTYRQLECEQLHGFQVGGTDAATIGSERANAVAGFGAALLGAWKSNAEYALNGLQAAADWQVLVQVVRAWNRAHDAGQGYSFQPVDLSHSLSAPGIAVGGGGCSAYVNGQLVGAPCLDPSNPTASCPDASQIVPLAALLVGQVLNGSSQPGTDAPGGVITIHTGAARNVPQGLTLRSTAGLPGVQSATGGTSSTSSPSSGAAKAIGAIAVAGGAGAGALALYASSQGITLAQALRRLVG